MEEPPTLEAWEATVDEDQRADPLWRMTAYRLALYAVVTGWFDARRLYRLPITRGIAAQLYEGLGSISANLAEGYSRSSGLDRVRFFEYALGSTRESAAWYVATQPVLGATVVARRIAVLTRIRQLLLAAIPRERPRRVRPREP